MCRRNARLDINCNAIEQKRNDFACEAIAVSAFDFFDCSVCYLMQNWIAPQMLSRCWIMWCAIESYRSDCDCDGNSGADVILIMNFLEFKPWLTAGCRRCLHNFWFGFTSALHWMRWWWGFFVIDDHVFIGLGHVRLQCFPQFHHLKVGGQYFWLEDWFKLKLKWLR